MSRQIICVLHGAKPFSSQEDLSPWVPNNPEVPHPLSVFSCAPSPPSSVHTLVLHTHLLLLSACRFFPILRVLRLHLQAPSSVLSSQDDAPASCLNTPFLSRSSYLLTCSHSVLFPCTHVTHFWQVLSRPCCARNRCLRALLQEAGFSPACAWCIRICARRGCPNASSRETDVAPAHPRASLQRPKSSTCS